MAAFLAWERRARYLMLPLAYFGRRGFATANAVVVFFRFISVIGSLFFITQLFQVGMRYSPLQAGLRILVWMAMPMVVAPITGALADRMGNKPYRTDRSKIRGTWPWPLDAHARGQQLATPERMACHAATIPQKALLPGQLADVVGYRRRPVRNTGLRAGPRYPCPGR